MHYFRTARRAKGAFIPARVARVLGLGAAEYQAALELPAKSCSMDHCSNAPRLPHRIQYETRGDDLPVFRAAGSVRRVSPSVRFPISHCQILFAILVRPR